MSFENMDFKCYRDAVARQSGFQVLAFWDNGFRHISNAVRPLRSPAMGRRYRRPPVA